MAQEQSPTPAELSARMRDEWDRRVQHDYRYWMSDGVASDEEMWAVGTRDVDLLLRGLDSNELAKQSALELGCGVGRLLRASAARFARVTGLDVSQQAIETAKRLLADVGNVDFVRGNGFNLGGVPDSSIDFAYSFAALSSMPVSVTAAYLKELSRVLKGGSLARLQVYLGREQDTCQEDTIAIRSYTREAFTSAAEAAGFALESIEELVLPFEISSPEQGLIAYIVTLRRCGSCTVSPESIERLLLPLGEHAAGAQWKGSQTEYFMALARAQQHIANDRPDLAREALEFAVRHYGRPDSDVLQLLTELRAAPSAVAPVVISSNVIADTLPRETAIVECGSDIFERNAGVLSPRFPSLAAELRRVRTGEDFQVSENAQGQVVCSFRGTALIHAEKPVRAAEAWAEQTLNAVRVREAVSILVCGFGAGYQLEQLVHRTDKHVYVFEPEKKILRGVLENRDLRSLLSRLNGVYADLEELRRGLSGELEAGRVELVVLPQSLAVSASTVDELRRTLVSARGLQQLQPRIGVVGPMYGGSLPIAKYTARALMGLKQRTTGFDLSSFYESFRNIGGFVKSQARRDVLESEFVELISRSVLEGITERPIDILICLAQAPMSPEVLEEIRSRGIITVMWFVEDCHRFQTWKHLSPYFDYMFIIQRGAFIEEVRDAGAGKAIYLPVGCDPDIHCPMHLTDEDKARYGSEISFLGAGYNNRRHMFAYLANRNFKIWGTEWPDCMPFNRLVQEKGRRIEPEEYIKIFNASAVNLNLHSSMERDGVEPFGDFVNPRTFELASAGAFQLVDERTLLPELFDLKRELAVFHDAREMQDQIDYYLERPEERSAVCEASRKRALSEHTYQHRVKTMLEYIYADRFEQLKGREQTGTWHTTLQTAKEFPELERKLRDAYERGDEPSLDSILPDIAGGRGSLSETEQKLLFLHHIRSQTTYIQQLRNEKAE